jgi:hypothetical protein
MITVPTIPVPKRINKIRLARNTVLIGAAGFEDRAIAALKLLDGPVEGNVIVITYKCETTAEDQKTFIAAARENGVSDNQISKLQYQSFEPVDFSESLKARLAALRANRVILDISAMSKLAILLCLDICRELHLDVSVHYAEALTYGPTLEKYQEARAAKTLNRPSFQIYTGVRGVVRVGRFSSVAMQGQPTAAIAFMSFNEELIQALLDSVYPSRLFLINGEPPILKWREEATAWIHSRLVSEWPTDNPLDQASLPKRKASTLDYRQAFEVLRQLYWDLNVDHRILLAPTGSKMQTLACFLMVAVHPDIHVEYPTPQGFLKLYSTGIGKSWVVTFGKLDELVQELAENEQRQYLQVATRESEYAIAGK